jgi:hypothetical protein
VTGPLWPWVALALLGAMHGLNPGMGWLFAVALGLQERDREQPSHAGVETVQGPEQRERHPGPERTGHDGKQNESDDASPPSSRT